MTLISQRMVTITLLRTEGRKENSDRFPLVASSPITSVVGCVIEI